MKTPLIRMASATAGMLATQWLGAQWLGAQWLGAQWVGAQGLWAEEPIPDSPEATGHTFIGLGLIATGALVAWLIHRSRV